MYDTSIQFLDSDHTFEPQGTGQLTAKETTPDDGNRPWPLHCFMKTSKIWGLNQDKTQFIYLHNKHMHVVLSFS